MTTGLLHWGKCAWAVLVLGGLCGCSSLNQGELRAGAEGTSGEGGSGAGDGGGGGNAGGGAGAGGHTTGVAGQAGPSAGSDGECSQMAFYRDADGDGVGDDQQVMSACGAPDGYVAQAGDCDDACASCLVGAGEQCDGADNDCDGETDEDISGSCGSMIGICRAGTQTCEAGQLSACAGEVAPGAEACDGMLDENCDGTVDEGCPCTEGEQRPCGVDEGECQPGQQRCMQGTWGACAGATEAGEEICDAKDNDCDGTSDEKITMVCGSDVGECSTGISSCAGGAMGACANETGKTDEICDGKDNDCDNLPDEGVTRPCNTTNAGKGICKAGTETCSSGTWGPCLNSVTATTEVCDAAMQDENCDGNSNETCACTDGQTGQCGKSEGACEFGSWTCNNGTWGPTCSGGKGPGTETCNNVDDDCDNLIDEKLTQTCGQSSSGVCRLGTETCNRGNWVNCDAVNPGPAEICDVLRRDEDCDGLINEDCKCTNGSSQSCIVSGGPSWRCTAGTQTCSNGDWGTCTLAPSCRCSKSADCPTGYGCATDGICYEAYRLCSSNAGCPPGFNCTGDIGATGNSCKPPCTGGANPEDPTLCPRPASASSNIATICYSFPGVSGEYCMMYCKDLGAGGCPYTTMQCRGITGHCFY